MIKNLYMENIGKKAITAYKNINHLNIKKKKFGIKNIL